jgi:hypothetical protein
MKAKLVRRKSEVLAIIASIVLAVGGLTLLVMSPPMVSEVFAQSGGNCNAENPCPTGYICCGGNCLSTSH